MTCALVKCVNSHHIASAQRPSICKPRAIQPFQPVHSPRSLHTQSCRAASSPSPPHAFRDDATDEFEELDDADRALAAAPDTPSRRVQPNDRDDDEEDDPAPTTVLPSTSYDTPADDAESRSLALAIAKIAWETKAEDVMVLHVAPLVYWTRYMVFASAFSRPQLGALLAKASKAAEEEHGRTPSAGGEGRSEWELLDFGDVVVHVMTPEQRAYYDLESFYGAAEELDLPFVEAGAGRGGPSWETSL